MRPGPPRRRSVGVQFQPGAARGGELRQVEDALAAHLAAIADDRHVGPELLGKAYAFEAARRCRPRVLVISACRRVMSMGVLEADRLGSGCWRESGNFFAILTPGR